MEETGLISLGWRLSRAQATMRRKRGRERIRSPNGDKHKSRRKKTPRWRSQRLGAPNPTSGLRGDHHEAMKAGQAGSSQAVYCGGLGEARRRI